MREKGADEVMLETEVTNTAAVRLYENRGFFREKRLYRFYLNGNDAFRLILPLIPISPPTFKSTSSQQLQTLDTQPLSSVAAPPPLPPRPPSLLDRSILDHIL